MAAMTGSACSEAAASVAAAPAAAAPAAASSSRKARFRELLLSHARKKWDSEISDLGEGCVAPFRVTPLATIEHVVSKLNLTASDVLYDLGCGEAHWCIAATKASGCRSVGIELSPEIAARARMHADKVLGSGDGGKASLVRVEFRDMMDKNGLDGVEEATVVVVYMGREASRRLSPELKKRLRAGTRVISIGFQIPDWEPVSVEKDGTARAYTYVVVAES